MIPGHKIEKKIVISTKIVKSNTNNILKSGDFSELLMKVMELCQGLFFGFLMMAKMQHGKELKVRFDQTLEKFKILEKSKFKFE